MEVCGDMGSQGATCDHFLTSQPRDIDKNAWDNERFGQLCISPDAWADLKREIEQLCSVSKECDYQTEQKMKAAVARINRLNH